MPHKYTTPETITGIKSRIAGLDAEIARRRAISKKDKEGIDIFVDFLKKLLDSSRRKKNLAMDGLLEDGKVLIESSLQEKMSYIFRGEERAIGDILDMLENPDAAVDIFVEEREELKKNLAYYEQMEMRKPESDENQ